MIVVGLDENGLGPLLGPLCVTAAIFEAPDEDPATFREAFRELTAADSKDLFHPHALGPAEVATRAWLSLAGIEGATVADLRRQLVVPRLPPCAAPPPGLCLTSTTALPRWSSGADAAGRITPEAGSGARQVRLVGIEAEVLCAGAYNELLAGADANKLRLDFSLMLGLVRRIVARHGEVLAWCGKIGSTRRYGPWLAAEGVVCWSALEESSGRSTYRVPGIGRLEFLRDGDGSHLPIAVASMVGKYLRELAMDELNRAFAPLARPVSGYRDARTAAFVTDTAEIRQRTGLCDACFLRRC